MNFKRVQSDKLFKYTEQFPVVCLVGPRQAGKTTMARTTLPDYRYVSLEDLDVREYAQTDPRGFLSDYSAKTIIDEAQRAPELFSYMQTRIDEIDTPGQYILTGSAHMQLLDKLAQSLAGRAGILKLLPMSLSELRASKILIDVSMQQLFKGFYPRIYKHHLDPSDWYPNYIQTYLEKDVRELLNIKNLITFKRFLKFCAGRHGQVLNISELSNDAGIDVKTVHEWLSVLQASFILYTISPYHKNFSKRLIKAPKLYFYDSGLVCSLLGIETVEQLRTHYLRGAIFEGYVITECMKYRYNLAKEPHVYFWRDHNGQEVDCIMELAGKQIAIEIKSGKTVVNDFFKGLKYWQGISDTPPEDCFLVHGGEQKQDRSIARVLGWQDIDEIFLQTH